MATTTLQKDSSRLLELPSEIILHAASYLYLPDLCQLRCVCFRLADVLVESNHYAPRFQEARIRMYKQRNANDRSIKSEVHSVQAFERVLLKLHPHLRNRLREVTFLLASCTDEPSAHAIKRAVGSIFTLLGSGLDPRLKLRLTRGAGYDGGYGDNKACTTTSVSLPDLVFEQLFATYTSDRLQLNNLLVNLEKPIDDLCLKNSHKNLSLLSSGKGLRALKRLHLNIYPPEQPSKDVPHQYQLRKSHGIIRQYAGIISLLSKLEALDLIWVPQNDEVPKWSVSMEVEKFTLNRVLQDSVLPCLRSLRLSGSTWFDCWCTGEVIIRSLDASPLLESLTLADIVLQGTWSAIFNHITDREPKLEEYTLQHLRFWLPPQRDQPDDSNIYQVRFIDGGRSKTSIYSRKTHIPLHHQAELAWDISSRSHYWQNLSDFVSSSEINDETVSLLIEHYENVWPGPSQTSQASATPQT